MQMSANPFREFFLRQLSLARTAVTERVHEREHFVQDRIPKSRGWNRLVQRHETDASLRSFGMRPHRRKVGTCSEMPTQRLRGVGGDDAPGHFPSPGRKGVFQTVNEEFLDRWE